ncbi:hypothetical protein ACOYR1_12580 [Thalassotalea piscium]
MISLLQDFYRGFVGGPDFNQIITHRFMLDEKQLTVSMPDSNVVAAVGKIKFKEEKFNSNLTWTPIINFHTSKSNLTV